MNWLPAIVIYSAIILIFLAILAFNAEEEDDTGLCMNCEHGPQRHHARREGGFIVWVCLATSWAEDSCECDHYRPRVKQICSANSPGRIPR